MLDALPHFVDAGPGLGVNALLASGGGDGLLGGFFVVRRTGVDGSTSIELLGSVVIWILLVLSALSIGLLGSLALASRRRSMVPPELVGQVRGLVTGGRAGEVVRLTEHEGSYFGRVLHAALTSGSQSVGTALHALEQEAEALLEHQLRRVELLNVAGQVSPMIGLFGTVYGMILAFRAIVASGGAADPVLLAGGIGTALTTTFWGLVVAIPAMSGFAIIKGRVEANCTEAVAEAESIVQMLRKRTTTTAGGDV